MSSQTFTREGDRVRMRTEIVSAQILVPEITRTHSYSPYRPDSTTRVAVAAQKDRNHRNTERGTTCVQY